MIGHGTETVRAEVTQRPSQSGRLEVKQPAEAVGMRKYSAGTFKWNQSESCKLGQTPPGPPSHAEPQSQRLALAS